MKHSDGMRLALFLVAAVTTPWMPARAVDEAEKPPFAFERHVVDAGFEKGYQVTVADIDADGRPDLVALSTNPSRLVWYANPAWERFDITTESKGNIDLAPYDVDGDGDQDLALASEFDLGNSMEGGEIHWLECPVNPRSGVAWKRHFIDAVPASHRVRWVDITGDGRKELTNLPIIGEGAVAPDYAGGVAFKAYFIPANPAADPWTEMLLDGALEMAHGMCMVHWEDSVEYSLLTASFEGVHFFHKQEHSLELHKQWIGGGHEGTRPGIGSSEVGYGRVDDTHRFIATIEPWHGNEVVVYTPSGDPEALWTRRVLDDTFKDGHGLICVDLNSDGIDEIVAGHRGPDYNLYLYHHIKADEIWRRVPLDLGGISVAGLAAADLNQDGRTDLIAIGTATNNVVWYENIPAP